MKNFVLEVLPKILRYGELEPYQLVGPFTIHFQASNGVATSPRVYYLVEEFTIYVSLLEPLQFNFLRQKGFPILEEN